jgi:hypothetical protein
MTFSYTPYGGITRHLPQGLDAVGEQEGCAAHAGGGEGSLRTSMAPANYYNIIFIKYLHNFIGLDTSAE